MIRTRSRNRCGGINSYQSIGVFVPSTVFDLDATLLASYPGNGQVWYNLEDTPADGSARFSYNMALGLNTTPSTDDPTFTGTAGSPSAYWAFDGTDRFTLNGSNTTFLNAMHKTTGGTAFWMAAAFKVSDFLGGLPLMTTNLSSTALGMRMNISSGETIGLIQGDGTTGKVLSASAAQTIGSYITVILSYDGVNVRQWINTRTKTVTPNTMNVATADAANTFSAFVNSPVGTELKAISMGNSYIDDADAGKILDLYNSRHGRTYA